MKYALLLLLLTVGANAFGHSAAHYVGFSRDISQFLVYIEGGEFLGQRGSLLTIRTAIRITKSRAAIKTADSCLYLYNPRNHDEDRIECAANSGGPLSGVVYVRHNARFRESQGKIEHMVCDKGCSAKVPMVLQLDPENCAH